jgi:hypothetical protein
MNVIARNGRLFRSAPARARTSRSCTSPTASFRETANAIFTWTEVKTSAGTSTGHQDIDYVPTGNFPGPKTTTTGDGILNCAALAAAEAAVELRGRPLQALPVILPEQQDLTFGPWYSGTPYLGGLGSLPPGQGGFNPNGGFVFMWHSHNEKEIVNFDIFPGGLLTMMVVEHPSVVLTNP